MITTLLAFLWILSGPRQEPAPADTPAYAQTYKILIKGELAGQESVEERADKDGNIVAVSEHEIFVTDRMDVKRMAFVTTLVLAKETMVPIRYSLKYTSGQAKDSFEVTSKGGRITRVLNRGGRSSESSMAISPNLVLLDINVYHQYDYLLRRYDMKRGGRQTFRDYIPVIGNEIQMAITLQGDSKLDTPKGILPVRDFKIEFVGIRNGIFSVDKAGRLVRLQVKEEELEVLREDLLPATP